MATRTVRRKTAVTASPLEKAYAAMGYSGPMPGAAVPASAAAASTAADSTLAGIAPQENDPPALGIEQLEKIEELFEIDPEETVARLREAWDPTVTEDSFRTALASARALIDRPQRFLPVLEASAAVAASPPGLPAGFEFPGMDLARIPINPEDQKFEEAGDALGWVVFAAFPALFPRSKAAFQRAQDFSSKFQYALPDPTSQQALDIALFADFGTGRYYSRYIAKQFEESRVPVAIHLGDVYYAGRQSEFREFIEEPLNPILESTELFLLNSNHEMYSGGKWYFDYIARKRGSSPRQRQEGSYFSLVNEKFQILGIDTAYHRRGRFPKEELQAWLKDRLNEGRAAGRVNILLSADHPYEYGKNSFTKLFATDLMDNTLNRLVDLWFWGNTHYCALFDRTNTARFLGSCIGHGGFPYTTRTKGRFSVAPVRFLESRSRFPADTRLRPDMGNNGYCRMSLHADGSITLNYLDWMRKLRCTAQLARPDASSPLAAVNVVEHND